MPACFPQTLDPQRYMAYTLAAVHKKKVLVIDNDKQGNASKAFDRYDTEDKNTIARVMLERNFDVSEIVSLKSSCTCAICSNRMFKPSNEY